MKMIRKALKDAEEENKEEQKPTKTIADQLRSIACDELISYHAYTAAARNISGENWMDVKTEFEQHAKEELGHYESILSRLWTLGEDCPAVFKSISEMAGYYWDIETKEPKEACEIALKAEEEAIKGYRMLLATILEQSGGDRDFATQQLAKQNLATEEEHRQDIDRLLQEF